MTKVKICGIKTIDEALASVEAGADMLGFNFYQSSPRYITPGECMRLTVQLETALRDRLSSVALVGVFVNAEAGFIHAVFRDCHFDLIQLSGDEPPDLLDILGERAFKALRPESPEALAESVRRYHRPTVTPAWLVDAYRPGEYGGTGQTADWGLARQLAEQSPILLAGGLKPENVGEAVRQVNPWGVDVASGVESAPGVKDIEKIRAFIRAVRAVSQEPAR